MPTYHRERVKSFNTPGDAHELTFALGAGLPTPPPSDRMSPFPLQKTAWLRPTGGYTLGMERRVPCFRRCRAWTLSPEVTTAKACGSGNQLRPTTVSLGL